MRKLQFKFPNQIRISGWDFGSSARAMNQAGGKDSLMTYEVDENELYAQADLEKVSRSTTERKSMSTKTTIKRIALVAVSALGLGVLSSVAPASAAKNAKTTMNVVDISFTTDKAPVAGANGTSSIHTIVFSTDSSTATTVNAYAVLVSKPATSAMAQEAEDGSLSAAGKWQMAIGVAAGHSPSARTKTDGTAYDAADQGDDNSTPTGALANTNKYYTYNIHAWYDVAGTYVWQIRDEAGANTINNGIDYSENFTVVVPGSSNSTTVTGTLSAFNSTSVIESTNGGSIIKVGLKDASGNAVAPDTASGVTLTVGGSAKIYRVNGSSAGSVSSYALGAGDFDADGFAYVNIVDATAETVNVSVANNGFSAFTAPSSITLKFVDSTNDATTATPKSTGSGLGGTSSPYSYSNAAGSKTTTWQLDDIAALDAYDYVTVTDTSGKITGLAGAVYGIAVARTSSTVAGRFSVATTDTSSNYTFSVNATGGATITAQAASRSVNSVTVLSSDSYKALTASTQSFTVQVKDNFGAAYAAQTVSASIAGRNAAVTVASVATDASGLATLTYKDASTSTTSMVDTITFTAGTNKTDTASVTYVSSLGVSSVLLVTPNTTSTGVTEAVATYTGIDATSDGAENATGATLTATVKDANGAVLSGVPVTFTVSGTGAMVRTSQATVVTGADGKAASNVFAWFTGTYTVTATAGGVSDTAPVNFRQEAPLSARVLSVAVDGSVVTATVKDRFGNKVKGVSVSAKRTSGSGSFNGVSTASGDTDENGEVSFILSGGVASVKVSVGTSETYGQTDALAGLIDGVTATSVFTAYEAGNALEDAAYVGDTFSPAGVNNVSVDVSATGATDAVDAANDAVEAANAATDAANAAAEAADAATAAAQDAQAAVADLAAQVATLISGIKAQITRLTNLVIKIQKKVRA